MTENAGTGKWAPLSPTTGPTLWLDANAPPGGDGSRERPFKSLRDAEEAMMELASAHYTLFFENGVYPREG